MAEFDQPALWDFILEETGAEKITYIGHSQGTTQLFASMCERPAFYQKHLMRFVALAPVVSINNMRAQVLRDLFAENEQNVDFITKKFSLEMLTTASNFNFFSNLIVGSRLGESTSEAIIAKLSDSNPKRISAIGMKNYLKFYPAGTTQRQLLHFLQMLRDGEFRKFDFRSEEKNMEAYGQAEPPHYDLDAVKGFKITLVGGTEDLLSSPEDYQQLCEDLQEIGNEVNLQEYELGHIGLVLAEDKAAPRNLFQSIVADYAEEQYLPYAKK